VSKKIVVIIPALDEEATIGDLINRCHKVGNLLSGMIDSKLEVIVVNDGSKDRTPEISKQAGAMVISHNSSQGVGSAFKSGINAALEHGADIIVNLDGDGQMYPEDIPKMIKPILTQQADLVIANRFYYKYLPFKMSKIKRFGNWFFTKLTNAITGIKLNDVACGYRAYSRKAAAKLNLFGKFTYTQEAIIDAIEKDLTIKEIPLYIKAKRVGKSRVVKSVVGYGLQALNIIYRIYRNNKPMKFFGFQGLFLFLCGLFGEGYIVYDRVANLVSFNEHPTLLIACILLNLVGLQLVIFGMMSDMNVTLQKTTEEILWREKYWRIKG
jgi:glycosyltransferase involved in cell wall biosynthesis